MYELRDYQKTAVNNTLNYFRKTNAPAVIVLPTGAGKSLVIAELARIAKGRVLVLAHVKELVEQNHQKYESYGLEAGIYSAGLSKKESHQKVIFGSIQSVARANDDFFKDFTLVVIDECHRVGLEQETQYSQVIKKLQADNEDICVLGLTATPYRMGLGWIFNYSHRGVERTKESRFFKNCVYELPLDYMIKHKYLTPPVKIEIPVTSYDFSELMEKGSKFTNAEVEEVLQSQRRLTPLIVKNIVDIAEKYDRKGIMIFSSTVNHAKEILEYLPKGEAQIILGDTDEASRDQIINDFKDKKIKYLVNVSVLTTGFDAPHVDVIAILRPTDSVSLYQQIIGRGLRLAEGKKDCLVLDYAGIPHDIYAPEIGDKKPTPNSVNVPIPCPQCGFENNFWGKVDDDGNIIEHYGRTCRGGIQDPETMLFKPCGYRFRFKTCPSCQTQNDLSARECQKCKEVLVDADTKLKQARLSKGAHILKPDSIELEERIDKRGKTYLQVRYYDFDAKYLAENHYFESESDIKKFNVNFLRSHMRRPEFELPIESVSDAIRCQPLYRMPAFLIARKQGKFWRITEKIFAEEL